MRKATPVKASSATTGSKKTARPAKQQPAKPTPQASKAASGKSRPAQKPQAKTAPKVAARPAAKQTADKQLAPKKSAASVAPAVTSKTPPAKTAATKTLVKQAVTTKPASRRPATRPAGLTPQQRQLERDEAAALRAFERAHKEFVHGHFEEARRQFLQLIEQHRGVSEVVARSRTYLTIAESRLRTESTIPRDAEALYDRGVIELNRGDYVAAQEMFERALKRDENAADVHYALAATRARLGSVETAMKSLERAIDLKPTLRVRAQNDPDIALLRNEPEYEQLVFPSRH